MDAVTRAPNLDFSSPDWATGLRASMEPPAPEGWGLGGREAARAGPRPCQRAARARRRLRSGHRGAGRIFAGSSPRCAGWPIGWVGWTDPSTRSTGSSSSAATTCTAGCHRRPGLDHYGGAHHKARAPVDRTLGQFAYTRCTRRMRGLGGEESLGPSVERQPERRSRFTRFRRAWARPPGEPPDGPGSRKTARRYIGAAVA